MAFYEVEENYSMLMIKNILSKFTISELVERFQTVFADQPALNYVDDFDSPVTYAELSTDVKELGGSLQAIGVEKGDKVAILSASSPQWGKAYLATGLIGAVNVPILPDFHNAEIENILNHSETKVIFVSKSLVGKLKGLNLSGIEAIVSIEDFSLLTIEDNTKNTLPAVDFSTVDIEENDLLSIIYTSGTTGKSKGVMLSHKNIIWNAQQSGTVQIIQPDDRFLSVLPMAHTYENTIGFILPILSGASVFYLKKPPVASVLLPALAKVRPTIMLSVPLIMEKIYKSKVKALVDGSAVLSVLYKFPPVRRIFNNIAGKKVYETFGGQLKFFGVGGAKIEGEVERFLRDSKFPYAIGYGLTETAPLLAGANPSNTIFQGVGPIMQGVELKLHDIDPKTSCGEVWANTPSMMKGYYKEPELTREVITEDGWFRTGDLGLIDKKGNLILKGRLKNMLLGASGENIYPEEIESIINTFKYVMESVVVQKGGKLVAMVHFNKEELEGKYKELMAQTEDYLDGRIEELTSELQQYVNSRVNRFSQIQVVLAQPIPFEKTPTMKIKRFLYS